ncbi:MAG: MMPL family transporter, partial [Thermodesulfobacteriota bacterium]
MKQYLRYIVLHPYRVLSLVLVVTVLFGIQIPRLEFHTSMYDMTIENLPENIQYNLFKEEFGSEEIIAVVVKSENVFNSEVYERLDRLAQRLSEVKGVKRVISLPGIKKAIDITDKFSLADFEAILEPAALLVKTVISADKHTTMITLLLEDVKDKDPIVNDVRAIIEAEQAGPPSYQIGLPIIAQALAKYTEKDFLTLPPIAFGVIILVLFYLFRSVRGVLVPAGALLVALTWTLGLMAVTDTPLAMLTMIVPIFLIAVGTAYCLHVLAEYRRVAGRAESATDAAFQCVFNISFPTILAVATTVIGLGSLLVNKIHAIRELAVFASFGIISMLAVIFTFVPALLALLPLPKSDPGPDRSQTDFFDRVLRTVVETTTNRKNVLLPVIVLISLAAGGGIFFIRVENNPVEYFKPDTPISRDFHDVYQDMSGSIPINVVLEAKTDGYFQNPGHLQDLARLQDFLLTLDGVDKTESLADYLKLVNYATNKYDKAAYALPEEPFEVRILTNSFRTILGQDLLRHFMDPDFSKANVVLRTRISSSRDCLVIERKILDYAQANLPQDLEVEVTGFGLVMAHSSHILTRGQVQSLSINLVLVFGIMFLLFLSLKVGFIALLPNLFPIIVYFGLLGWLGLELSAATSLIASVAIGLAVDDTIHYLFRYNREFKKDLDKKRALKDTIEHVGRPMIFTTLTISLGFSILLFSSFKPTSTFGLMMVVTMFAALAGDLFLLPALMLNVELVTIWDLVRLKLGQDPQEGMRLFQGMSRSQVHYVLMAGTLKRLEAGKVLFHKGETSDSMYAIISGSLEVLDYVKDVVGEGEGEPTGPTTLIVRLQPGDIVGEMGLVRSCRRTATVMARGPVELLEINRAMIKRLTWLYPPTAQRFFFNLMTILCDRLEHTTTSLSQMATTDFTTGLYYRSHFTRELDKELYRSQRYTNPLCLLVADLVDYQAICGKYGPEAGERALVEISGIMRTQLRSCDLACRWGVQAFTIMLPNTSKERA